MDSFSWTFAADDVVKLHLESLPASASPDIIKYYFGNVGENVSVVSVVFEEDAMLVPKVALCPDDWLRAAVPSSHRRLAWLGFLV